MNTNNMNNEQYQNHLTEDGYIKPSGLSLPTQSYAITGLNVPGA